MGERPGSQDQEHKSAASSNHLSLTASNTVIKPCSWTPDACACAVWMRRDKNTIDIGGGGGGIFLTPGTGQPCLLHGLLLSR